MKREEHKEIIQKIMANAGNQGELSLLLTQLSEDYEKVLTESETATANVATLNTDNENLRRVNMELFLKVGHPKQDTHADDKGGNPDPEIKGQTELTFEKLFDENGGLK